MGDILLFPGVRRDRETGRDDIAALIAAAELAGKVRRIPAGLRALPEPMVAPVFPSLPPLTGRRVDPVIYDEAAEDDCA